MNRPKNATILKDPESSSACELVYEICRQTFSDMLDSEIATFLYLGLLTDT